jgi:alkylhydroperoxidase/carboxymuconolactone decarboxylase family protein YurZ
VEPAVSADAPDDLVAAAAARAERNFIETSGAVPDGFALLRAHAPEAFAGYGLMRAFATRAPQAGGALDRKTSELVFALLDVLIGDVEGAKGHAARAVAHGLTLPELAQGLVQVVMVGGVGTWNRAGAAVLRHCEGLAAEVDARRPRP